MFDQVYVLNLDRRPDRMREFWKGFAACGWPFQTPIRVSGLDGRRLQPPQWWSQQPGAWGCLLSHFALYQDALNRGYKSIFIFEDDCVFADDCAQRIKPFFDSVPQDWDQIYIGGLPRALSERLPVEINPLCYQMYRITGTWATGYKTEFLQRYMAWAWDFLYNTRPLGILCHLDRMYSEFQKLTEPKIYAPKPWLVGMSDGASDICNRVYSKPHYFNWDYASGIDLNNEIGAVINDRVLIPLSHARLEEGEESDWIPFGQMKGLRLPDGLALPKRPQ